MLKFALKASKSERFGPKWFKRAPQTERSVRPTTRRTFLERQCRTERSRNNPLEAMTRLLNELYSSELVE